MMPRSRTAIELYTEYPKLFPKNTLDCSLGWLNIIADMCAAIQIYLNLEDEPPVEQVEFIEIKERYGVLTISYTGGDGVVAHIIKYCEQLSYRTCSICGVSDATLYCSSKWRNWSHGKILCEPHALELFYFRLS